MKLILASKSPRRIEYLKMWGFSFESVNASFDERILNDPINTVIYNSFGKASKVLNNYKNSIVIGLDTVVSLENKIIGKPKDKEDLRTMLKLLSNKTHLVTTGMAVIQNKKFAVATCKTTVTFRNLSDKEIDQYVKTGEGLDKAGGYAIQGIASDFIVKVEGLIDNVIGIPVFTLRKLLEEIER